MHATSARVKRLTGLTAALCAAATASIAGSGLPTTARTVLYRDRDVVQLHAKVRYTTLIVLPENDEVVEVTCGDKETWAVNAHGPLVSVKPSKTGAETNLNVLTTRGRIYAFVLTEISDPRPAPDRRGSDPPAGGPDLAVYIDRESDGESPQNGERYVPAQQLDDFRLQAQAAREDARRAADSARAQVEEGLTAFRRAYPLTLAFPYRFKADVAPFFVHAMFHDDRATFIQARAQELPALYEIKDGAPNLVNFEVHDGTYVVPKVLERGYLAVGQQRLAFDRAER